MSKSIVHDDPSVKVTVGVDTHKHQHVAVAIDGLGGSTRNGPGGRESSGLRGVARLGSAARRHRGFRDRPWSANWRLGHWNRRSGDPASRCRLITNAPPPALPAPTLASSSVAAHPRVLGGDSGPRESRLRAETASTASRFQLLVAPRTRRHRAHREAGHPGCGVGMRRSRRPVTPFYVSVMDRGPAFRDPPRLRALPCLGPSSPCRVLPLWRLDGRRSGPRRSRSAPRSHDPGRVFRYGWRF